MLRCKCWEGAVLGRQRSQMECWRSRLLRVAAVYCHLAWEAKNSLPKVGLKGLKGLKGLNGLKGLKGLGQDVKRD